jgi:hypothetical protein
MKNSPVSAASTSSTKRPTPAHTIASYRTEYAMADCFCAEVQSFVNLAGVPAVNELRNAGKHLLDALADDGRISSHDDLVSAVNHARRASYEAYEAGILSALEIIAQFRVDYKSAVVTDVVQNYTEILIKANSAQKAVEAGRQQDFDRASDHTLRMASFRDLRECCETLILAREEVNKKIARENKVDGVAAWTLRVAIITLFVAVLLAVWTATDFWTPWRHKAPVGATNAATVETPAIANGLSPSASQQLAHSAGPTLPKK